MSDESKEALGTSRVHVASPISVLPHQDEWLLLAFVDKGDVKSFQTWWIQEGQRVFDSWRDAKKHEQDPDGGEG